jgi:glycogen debranching enzyme
MRNYYFSIVCFFLIFLCEEGLNAIDSRDLGRFIHRFGGQPVGAFMQPPARPLVPSMAHALFYDQTHDNASPIQVKSNSFCTFVLS